jgi:hypothetical protein
LSPDPGCAGTVTLMVKKFIASFFQERRIFFSEEKKQKTFDYYGPALLQLSKMSMISIR